jgi:adenosine deaminase
MIDQTFPLIDLHRHLDGSIRLETVLDLGREHNLPLPAFDLDGLRPFVQVTEPKPGVMAFIDKFKWMVGVLVDYDACRRVSYENVEDAYKEGIDYIEFRFSPQFMAEPFSLNLSGVTEAVIDGVLTASHDFKVKTNLIGIISRTYGVEKGWEELNALIDNRDHLIGLDLAGDEVNFPGEMFCEHISQGRDAGLHITIHAGESTDSKAIWYAIDELGAERIGHGISAVEDTRLMQVLERKAIGIENNLTSNIQTSTVSDYQSHPLKQFLRRGIKATINTDDPGVSNITLPYEYNVAAKAVGLTVEQAHQAQRNALDVAFLESTEKDKLIAGKLEALNKSSPSPQP